MKLPKAFILVLLGLAFSAAIAIGAQHEQPLQEQSSILMATDSTEFMQVVKGAMGSGAPPGKVKEAVCEINKPNSPAFMLAKLMVIEKAIKKMRNTPFYEANKAQMEPLLKDMEKQVKILKGIAIQKLKQKGKTQKGLFARLLRRG